MKLWQRLLMQKSLDAPLVNAYRYFQIFIYTCNGGDLISIAEVEFLDETGTSFPLNLGSAPVASSVYPNYGPALTIDKNTAYNQAWLSNFQATNVSISYDANTAKIARKLRIFPQDNILSRSPKTFVVRGSNTSISGPWTDIKSFDTGGTYSTWREFDLA